MFWPRPAGPPVSAGLGDTGGVHLAEEAENVVVSLIRRRSVLKLPTEDGVGEESDVLGEHGYHALQHKTLCFHSVNPSSVKLTEQLAHLASCLTGDGFEVVLEYRCLFCRKQESHRLVAAGQVGQRDHVDRLIDLPFEVIDVELVEVAQHHVAGPVRDRPCPVVQGLAEMLAGILPGLLHLDEATRLPHQVSKRGTTVVRLLDAVLQRCASLSHSLVPKRAEEAVAEHLRLALLVTLQVLLAVVDELLKGLSEV